MRYIVREAIGNVIVGSTILTLVMLAAAFQSLTV